MKKFVSFVVASTIVASAASASQITGTGSSFAAPAYKHWSSAYYNATENEVTYTATGSGAGIRSIKKRLVNFGGTDKPLTPKVLRANKLYMFPTLIGSIDLAYNIPGIKDNQLKLSSKAIAGIFDGKIKYWDNAEIVKNNQGLHLPHKAINVCVRSDGSGTTFNFTYYLSKIDSKDFSAHKSFNWKANIIGGKGNQGVTSNIKQNRYSIGYIEYAYKLESGLPAATIENKEGYWIKPTVKSFQDGAKYASWSKKSDFYALIGNPKGKTSYPIIAATFVLIPANKIHDDKNVIKFFNWSFKHGNKIIKKLGYVPLPASTKNEIRSYWREKGL